MADPADDTTTLNPGAGGEVMDVSNVLADNGVPLDIMRERVVIGGELNRDAIAEVTKQPPAPWEYGLPTRGLTDLQILSELQGVRMELSKIRTLLELMFGGSE